MVQINRQIWTTDGRNYGSNARSGWSAEQRDIDHALLFGAAITLRILSVHHVGSAESFREVRDSRSRRRQPGECGGNIEYSCWLCARLHNRVSKRRW